MILLRTNKTGTECRFTFTFPAWLCQPHIHSNYTLWTRTLRRYTVCVWNGSPPRNTLTQRQHTSSRRTYGLPLYRSHSRLNEYAGGLSAQSGAASCQVAEDCCRRGRAKFTIKLSQAESRTPSHSLSLINWDCGSTWVSLAARFK